MQLFMTGLTGNTALGITTLILALIATIVTVAFVLLTFRGTMSKIFKVFALLILPVLSIMFWFALMFAKLGTFGGVLCYVVGFGIAVVCELLAFAIAYFICKRDITAE